MQIFTLLTVVMLTSLSGLGQSSTFTNLVGTTWMNVGTGQVARVVSAMLYSGSSPGYLNLEIAGRNFSYNGAELAGKATNGTAGPPIVAGPARIGLSGGGSSFCTVEVINPSGQLMPSTAVVIPADSTGPVKIILESSADLVNWNEALPGTYGTSTTNRFFRVRAVAQ
jgi:hypothetical protein